MHEGWLKNIIEKYITNALFCILKKEKKNSASSAPLSHQPPTTPNFLLLLLCHLLHRCPPHLHLHVFTPSTATSSHEASFWLANAWRPFLKREKNRCMILSVLKRTCCQVLPTALQMRRSSSTEISSSSCHAASIMHKHDEQPLKGRQAFWKASLFSGNTIGMHNLAWNLDAYYHVLQILSPSPFLKECDLQILTNNNITDCAAHILRSANQKLLYSPMIAKQK